MKNHENSYYLDEPVQQKRFPGWGWLTGLLPQISRLSVAAGPPEPHENSQRVQQYLDFLREYGPVPGHSIKPVQPGKSSRNA